MTFLVDPPLLGLVGIWLGARVDSERRLRRVAAALVGVFLVASVLLYLDVIAFWFGRWRTGSVWMLNSGLGTGLERSSGTDVLAAVILASYPLWAWAGLRVGRRVGRS